MTKDLQTFSACVLSGFTAEALSSQREYMFSFLMRGQKRKDLQLDASRGYSSSNKNTFLKEDDLSPLGLL